MTRLRFLLVLAVARPALAITVGSLGDDGPGTLREALIDATNGADVTTDVVVK
jgi:hypothetical protein